jgi:hypothetical protein
VFGVIELGVIVCVQAAPDALVVEDELVVVDVVVDVVVVGADEVAVLVLDVVVDGLELVLDVVVELLDEDAVPLTYALTGLEFHCPVEA